MIPVDNYLWKQDLNFVEELRQLNLRLGLKLINFEINNVYKFINKLESQLNSLKKVIIRVTNE